MRNPSLIVRYAQQVCRPIPEEKTYWPSSHGSAIAGGWRRFASFFPRYALRQPPGRGVGGKSPADDASFTKNRSDPVGIVRGIKPAAMEEAYDQVAGQLRVIGVLTEKVLLAALSFYLPGPHRFIHVATADGRRMPFHDEAQRITQALAYEATGKPVLIWFFHVQQS